MARFQLTDKDFDYAITRVSKKLMERLSYKGRGIFVSSHEILGILTEEYLEYENEVHVGAGAIKNQSKELVDIAVACLVGIASMHTGEMDWPR